MSQMAAALCNVTVTCLCGSVRLTDCASAGSNASPHLIGKSAAAADSERVMAWRENRTGWVRLSMSVCS